MVTKIIDILKKIRKIFKLTKNKFGSKKRNKKLKNKNFTIISNNCFAGVTYEYLNLPYLSPTIGLYFFAPEYIKFIKNIKYYCSLELESLDVKKSKYYDELIKLKQDNKVLGKIGDVEIVFLHYKSFNEAKEKWEKRCKRINYQNLIFKFCDQNLCTEKELIEFKKFKHNHKICFTSKKYDYDNFIQIKKDKNKKHVIDDVFDYHKYFNIVEYINNFEKKKILHVLFSNRFSGAENVACTIIENTNSDYEVAYCSPNGQISEILKEKNINYVPIKSLNLLELKRVFKKYNPDIIHSHDFMASFKCSLLKRKRILIAHIHNNYPWLKKCCLKSIIFLLYSFNINKILTVSESIENEYIFSKLIKKKIICIGNPVSFDKIVCKVKKDDNKKIYDICCVARITEQKNPLKFIEVINHIKQTKENIRAVWIGDSNPCDGDIKQRVMNKIKEMNLEKNIEFLGFKNNPLDYVMMSKLFLLTSDYEGFGLVAFEAMSLGVPCVVSNVGGLPNIVDNNCGFLCNDFDDYVVNCLKILNDETELNKKSILSIKKAKKIDNLNKYISFIKKIYNMNLEEINERKK